MATPEVLDFDALLAPISDDQPSGIALRDDPEASSLFFQIKEGRDVARTAERQLMHWYGEGDRPESPDWRPVYELAQTILRERSKDLWVAAWFLEALVRIHGFSGLRDGFRLIREICERHWDVIHPAPDEDGYAHTVSQLTGVFDGALSGPIDAIAITPETQGQPGLSSLDFKDAFGLEKLDPEERAKRIEQGAATVDMFHRTVRPEAADFFRGLLEDIDGAAHEFSKMSEALEERCGTDESGYSLAPPTSSILESVNAVRDLVRSLTRDLLRDESVDEEGLDLDGQEDSTGDGASAKGSGVGSIRNREEAFRALLLVSDFFRRTEPHSPVSYSLEQAVRWGRMPFPELMSELIADESARREMFRRAGVSEAPEDSG